MLIYVFIYLLGFFIVFYYKICVFLTFTFLTKYKFPQQNTDLSETEIHDQKLSVELYALLDCRIVVIVLDIIKYFILSLLNIKT